MGEGSCDPRPPSARLLDVARGRALAGSRGVPEPVRGGRSVDRRRGTSIDLLGSYSFVHDRRRS